MNQGENAPPLHPRCRCTIIASFGEKISGTRITEGRKKIPAEITYKEWRNGIEGLQRRTANQGIFSHLKIPMQKKAVVQICRKYDVDITGLRIKIQRGEEWLSAKYQYMGMTDYYDVGRIDLTPHAFANEEQLIRTIIHEGCHVKQLRKYGREYAQENIVQMEKTAERYEKFYWRIARQRQDGQKAEVDK